MRKTLIAFTFHHNNKSFHLTKGKHAQVPLVNNNCSENSMINWTSERKFWQIKYIISFRCLAVCHQRNIAFVYLSTTTTTSTFNSRNIFTKWKHAMPEGINKVAFWHLPFVKHSRYYNPIATLSSTGLCNESQ